MTTKTPRELDGEQWEKTLEQGGEFQLFDFADRPIEGFTSTHPLDEPYVYYDDGDCNELWPTPEGTYEDGRTTVAYWSVAA